MLLIQLALTFALLLLLCALVLFIIFWASWGLYTKWYIAPYVPSRDVIIAAALEHVGSGEGRTFLDIGAGDGKVVIAAARAGFTATGIEANPLLVHIARWRIKRAGLEGKATMLCGDFFAKPLPRADVAYMFLLPVLTARLAGKLKADLPSDATILINSFPIPAWKPSKQDGKITIYRLQDQE